MKPHRTHTRIRLHTTSILAAAVVSLVAIGHPADRHAITRTRLAAVTFVGSQAVPSSTAPFEGIRPVLPKLHVGPSHTQSQASEQSPLPAEATLGELSGETEPEAALGSAVPSLSGPAPFRFFAPTSFWNEPVAANAPLAPNSRELIHVFSEAVPREEARKAPPWINTTAASIPVYTVGALPTVRVTLVGANAPALQAAWSSVPLPATARPAVGSDKVLVVWQPSTDRLWDFWRLAHTAQGWRASWGGAMQNVSSDLGVYSPEAWPGAKPGWGDSASSIEPVGGLISLEDMQHGVINHALRMAYPEVRASVYSSPAQRTDGRSTSPLALPEGAHLRLEPSLNLAALHLPHPTLMIAEAAQRYGIVITDYAPNISFYAQDPTPTGANPYAGPNGYFEGRNPRELLASFPWSHLQVLKLSLHSNS